MTLIELARKLRPIIEQAAQSLDDKTASEGAELFPALKQDGGLVRAGTRINWNGMLKMAAVDLWDTQESNPDNAPILWQDILYRDGIRIIPSPITVTEKFSQGELGWWKEAVYESLVGDNVYTPDQHPSNWKPMDIAEVSR